MTYHFWLGHVSDELDEYMAAMVWERHEIETHQAKCKPEADGFITVIPNVRPGRLLQVLGNKDRGWVTI